MGPKSRPTKIQLMRCRRGLINFEAMKTKIFLISAFAGLAFSLPTFAAGVGMDAHVSLTLGSDFIAHTGEVSGYAIKHGDLYFAKNIVVHLKHLKTKISLRDRHTQKHLETDKYPDAVLVIAKGKDGRGKAKIQLHGKENIVIGTYRLIDGGKYLSAEFPISLSKFDITGIRYMGIGVKDRVVIDVTVPIKAAPAKTAKAGA